MARVALRGDRQEQAGSSTSRRGCIGATDFVPGHAQAAIFFLPPPTCVRERAVVQMTG